LNPPLSPFRGSARGDDERGALHRGPPTSQWEGHVACATGDIQFTDVQFKCQPSDEALGGGRANGLAIVPKLPAIQGARIASFIWSMSWLVMVISFSNSIAPFSRMMVTVRPP